MELCVIALLWIAALGFVLFFILYLFLMVGLVYCERFGYLGALVLICFCCFVLVF